MGGLIPIANEELDLEIAKRLVQADGYSWWELGITDRNRYAELAQAVAPMFQETDALWYEGADCGEDHDDLQEAAFQQACERVLAGIAKLDAVGRASAHEIKKRVEEMRDDGYEEPD